MKHLFIPNNVPSSKNSKVFTGRFLVNSPVVTKYYKLIGHRPGKEPCTSPICWYNAFKLDFLEQIRGKQLPIQLHLEFYRDSRRRFDYVNAAQLPLDLMVKHGWLVDDSADNVVPVFEPYIYDKEDPGVAIWVD